MNFWCPCPESSGQWVFVGNRQGRRPLSVAEIPQDGAGRAQALSGAVSSGSKSWTGWPGMMVEIACL
ncbi:hypothetical protein AEGHOMDF_2635 [Methylobacterium soli]|nr:hypothetical protein AEGHOMDF_2635 [Methylobacterium soli]